MALTSSAASRQTLDPRTDTWTGSHTEHNDNGGDIDDNVDDDDDNHVL